MLQGPGGPKPRLGLVLQARCATISQARSSKCIATVTRMVLVLVTELLYKRGSENNQNRGNGDQAHVT